MNDRAVAEAEDWRPRCETDRGISTDRFRSRSFCRFPCGTWGFGIMTKRLMAGYNGTSCRGASRLSWPGTAGTGDRWAQFLLLRRGYSDRLSHAPLEPAPVNSSDTRTCGGIRLPRDGHVSALSPLTAPWDRANRLAGKNCRYDGDYEKAMGIQTKGHQGMVDRMV
jgi:hypothetical protein